MNVYIVRSGSKGAIKIGKAVDVDARIYTLQCGNPEEIVLMGVIECGSEAKAFNIESQLHSIYSRSKVRGEWFKPCINLKAAEDKLGVVMPINKIYDRKQAIKKSKLEASKAKRKAKKASRKRIKKDACQLIAML